MQIKKDMLFSIALVVLSAWLLVAAKVDASPSIKVEKPCPPRVKCCKMNSKPKPASPWNFVTEGILHQPA